MSRLALCGAVLLALCVSCAQAAEKQEIGQLMKYALEGKAPGQLLYRYGFPVGGGISGVDFAYGGERYGVMLSFFTENADGQWDALPPEKLSIIIVNIRGQEIRRMTDRGLDGTLDAYRRMNVDDDPDEENVHPVTAEEQHEFDSTVKDILFFYRLMGP